MGERKPKILVVDDAKNIRNIVSLILGRRKYDFVEASDGSSALEKAGSEMPDLMLVDFALPKMNGLEVCLHMKQDPFLGKIPVMIMTSEPSDEIEKRALETADGFIRKPFDTAELRGAVEKLLPQ